MLDWHAARSQYPGLHPFEAIEVQGAHVTVRRLAGGHEAAACAEIMSSNEPWVTLGRTYARSLAVVSDPDAEVYVAVAPAVAGFLVLGTRGAFTGYIRAVALRAEWRGLGTALIAFAERRILRETPNVFLCVVVQRPGAGALPPARVRGRRRAARLPRPRALGVAVAQERRAAGGVHAGGTAGVAPARSLKGRRSHAPA